MNRILIIACILLTAIVSSATPPQKRVALNTGTAEEFLDRRLPSGVIMGTFAAYGSMLYAVQKIAIHTNDKEIGDVVLNSPFPDFYKPTGNYSADDPAQQTVIWERVRNSWATGFASHFKKGVTISEMQLVSVNGIEALYFEATPRPGVMWRQWALVKNGHAFVIVSTLPTDEKTLLAQVQSMVKSFRVE